MTAHTIRQRMFFFHVHVAAAAAIQLLLLLGFLSTTLVSAGALDGCYTLSNILDSNNVDVWYTGDPISCLMQSAPDSETEYSLSLSLTNPMIAYVTLFPDNPDVPGGNCTIKRGMSTMMMPDSDGLWEFEKLIKNMLDETYRIALISKAGVLSSFQRKDLKFIGTLGTIVCEERCLTGGSSSSAQAIHNNNPYNLP